MKVSLRWLADYVDITLSPEKLAEKLTMVGLEASDVHEIGKDWGSVFVGQITDIQQHPDADRLHLATVTLGDQTHTVVCGAHNITIGQHIAFATLGAKLFDGHSGKYMELKPAKIRGIRSEGMICSEMELGLSDNHEGILELDETTKIGTPLVELLGDTIFDISITPNRPDCLNMLGIAREVAAITGTTVKLPVVEYAEEDVKTADIVSIDILDLDLCPRYCGGIIKDVKIGPSPDWMQKRLSAAGMRPINNIVDITNFVMLEYGQPLHAFDYDDIGSHKIIVRRAQKDEKITTLDGEKRKLNPEMLVIADAAHPVALAGVMGGEDSEVTESTTTILLESANFNNISIRKTSRGLGLLSEASLRFDKGLSRELPIHAIRRAIQLMVTYAGGKATYGVVDAYPGDLGQKPPIALSTQKCEKVLGIDFGISKIKGTLESLGFECESKGTSELLVSVPYWRTDVTMQEDLIEEAARIIGYDAIPTTMLSGAVPHHQPNPTRSLRTQIQNILTGCGMQEVINYSLTSQEILNKTGYRNEYGTPVRLANPMSQDQECLRISLRGGLLTNMAANERHGEKGLMLFETGKVYLPREGKLPDEKEILAAIMGGPRSERAHLADKGSLDFFYAKGILETLFARLGIEAQFESAEDILLLPGKTASILIDGEKAGIMGELHPSAATSFDIDSEPVCLFEIEMQKLLDGLGKAKTFTSIPKYPSNDRDMALIVDADILSQKINDIISGFPQVVSTTLFDVYQGKQVPEGKKSLAFALRYQSAEKTLTDAEVDKIQSKILKKLQNELGATLR